MDCVGTYAVAGFRAQRDPYRSSVAYVPQDQSRSISGRASEARIGQKAKSEATLHTSLLRLAHDATKRRERLRPWPPEHPARSRAACRSRQETAAAPKGCRACAQRRLANEHTCPSAVIESMSEEARAVAHGGPMDGTVLGSVATARFEVAMADRSHLVYVATDDYERLPDGSKARVYECHGRQDKWKRLCGSSTGMARRGRMGRARRSRYPRRLLGSLLGNRSGTPDVPAARSRCRRLVQLGAGSGSGRVPIFGNAGQDGRELGGP